MWSADARQLVRRVASAVVFVEIKKPNNEIGIGSAFHIGDGYFVTARHVIEGNEILRVGQRDTSLVTQIHPSGQPMRSTTFPDFVHKDIDRNGIVHHGDDKVDLSIFRLCGNIEKRAAPASTFQPTVQLNRQSHLLTEGEFLMQEVIILGYPPIPLSADAHLVVFRGEVSAVINSLNNRRYFVISGMARGGFSGGPVISVENPNTVLGVVTDSFVKNGETTELGFVGATSAQAVLETIEQHKLRIQAVQMTAAGFILP
jgi:hypothetical protein